MFINSLKLQKDGKFMKKITKVLGAIILALTLCLVANHQTQAKEQLKEIVVTENSFKDEKELSPKNIIKKYFKFEYTYHPNKKVKTKKADVKFIMNLRTQDFTASIQYRIKYKELFNEKGNATYNKVEVITKKNGFSNNYSIVKKNYKLIKKKNIALYVKEQDNAFGPNLYKITTRHNNGKVKQIINHDYDYSYISKDENDINDYHVIKKYNKKGDKTSQSVSSIHGKKLRLKLKTKYHSNGKKKEVKAYKYNKKKKKVYLLSKKTYTKKGKLKQVKKYNKKGKVISNKRY